MMIAEASKHHLRQPPPSVEDAVNSVMLAKWALRDEPDKLDSLYQTIFAFKNHEIDTPAMVARVGQLLRCHDDLISSINAFLPDIYKVRDPDQSSLIQVIDFLNAIHRREIFSSFIDIMQKHADDPVVVFQKVSVLFREFPELIRDFKTFLREQPDEPECGPGYRSKTIKESVSKLGFLPEPDEPECGPSYRRKPTDEFVSVSTGRRKLGLKVLNDDWIFDARKLRVSDRPTMDKREIDMLDCEDERYEMDMLIERGKSAKEHIDNVINGRTEVKELTVLDFRYIEKLYGEQGLAVVDIVKKNPLEKLPIVRTRLEQKVAELSLCRQEMNRWWARVYHSDQVTDDMQCDDSDYYI